MDKTKSLYAIYKFDFHKSSQPSVQAVADGIDGNKFVSGPKMLCESVRQKRHRKTCQDE